MEELQHRLAIAALALGGLATLVLSWDPASPALPLVMHRQVMTALLGGGLLLSVFLPALRLPAVGAAVLTKAAWVLLLVVATPGAFALAGLEAALALLLFGAGAVFFHEMRREALWDRGALRQG
jgi:hypothetical protein